MLITKELIRWKLPVGQMPPIVWVLHLGLFWIPIAFLISIIEGIMAFTNPEFFFEKAVIHTLALGYFVTLLLGIQQYDVELLDLFQDLELLLL